MITANTNEAYKLGTWMDRKKAFTALDERRPGSRKFGVRTGT